MVKLNKVQRNSLLRAIVLNVDECLDDPNKPKLFDQLLPHDVIASFMCDESNPFIDLDISKYWTDDFKKRYAEYSMLLRPEGEKFKDHVFDDVSARTITHYCSDRFMTYSKLVSCTYKAGDESIKTIFGLSWLIDLETGVKKFIALTTSHEEAVITLSNTFYNTIKDYVKKEIALSFIYGNGLLGFKGNDLFKLSKGTVIRIRFNPVLGLSKINEPAMMDSRMLTFVDKSIMSTGVVVRRLNPIKYYDTTRLFKAS